LGNYHLSRPDIFCSLSRSDYAHATVRDCQWRRQGILFKSGTHLETIGRVRRSLWTNRHPYNQLQVVKTLAVAAQPENRVLQVAAALEVFLNIQLDKHCPRCPTTAIRIAAATGGQKLGKVLLEKSMVSEWAKRRLFTSSFKAFRVV